MELIPIIKQTLYIVTVLFIVTVAVSYFASKFKKPKKEVPPPAKKPNIINTKATTSTQTKTKTKATREETNVTVSKTKTSESDSEKIDPEKVKLPPNVVRRKSSKRKTRKKPEQKTEPTKKKNREPRFEVVKDLKKSGKKFNGGTDNNGIEFR